MQICFTFFKWMSPMLPGLKSITQTCLTPCPACKLSKQWALAVHLSNAVCFQSQPGSQSWWRCLMEEGIQNTSHLPGLGLCWGPSQGTCRVPIRPLYLCHMVWQSYLSNCLWRLLKVHWLLLSCHSITIGWSRKSVLDSHWYQEAVFMRSKTSGNVWA